MSNYQVIKLAIQQSLYMLDYYKQIKDEYQYSKEYNHYLDLQHKYNTVLNRLYSK